MSSPFSFEAMKKAFLDSLNEPWEKPLVIIRPALYKRVEKAVDEGAELPQNFGSAADVVWWLGEWEKKKNEK